MPFKRTILLGIVGDSAAGKTTLSAGIARILGEDNVTVICTDDYHRYNRLQRRENGISALDPACNYIDIMEQHFDLLRRGHPILKPIYNHSTGDFDPPEYIEPKKFVILEGLLGYHTKVMRDCFDVKVYLSPEEELRVRWKVKRDTAKRGYTEEQVRAALKTRIGPSESFIQPQKADADLVIHFYRPQQKSNETDDEKLNVRLVLRPTLPHPDLSDVIESAAINGTPSITSTIRREKGRLTEVVDIKGRISDERAIAIEKTIWNHLPDTVEHLKHGELGHYTYGDDEAQSHSLALTQLLVTYHLLVALTELERERKLRMI